MPLKRGKSKAAFESNLHEFKQGKTYARTSKKFGKKKADKQNLAVAFSQARKTMGY